MDISKFSLTPEAYFPAVTDVFKTAQVLRVGHIVTIFVDFSVLVTADSNSLEYIISVVPASLPFDRQYYYTENVYNYIVIHTN